MTLFWYIYFAFVVLNATVIYILWKTGNLGDYFVVGDIAMITLITASSFCGTFAALLYLLFDLLVKIWNKPIIKSKNKHNRHN